MEAFSITDQNKVKRSPQRGVYDHETIHAILDKGFVCHVGFIDGDKPFVIPMCYGRKHNTLYLHGASTSRITNLLTNRNTVCITVTHIDGIVVSRTMFDSSINYRSVVLFGEAQMIAEEDEKIAALKCISDYILPGRWEEVRESSTSELKATSVLKICLENGSAKIRSGPPDDDVRDLNLPVWAGVIPLTMKAATPVPDPTLTVSQPVPASVFTFMEKSFIE